MTSYEAWARSVPGLTLTQAHVLMALARDADELGRPGRIPLDVDRTAHSTALPSQVVLQVIDQLQSAGLVSRILPGGLVSLRVPETAPVEREVAA